MKVFTIDVDPANVDADGLADGKSSAGASVTLDGALTSGGSFTSADGLGHQLVITDAGAHNQTTATYTVTGTDADGNAQVESLAGPNTSASVETTKYFASVSSVAIASPVAGSTVDIGTVDEVSSKTFLINRFADFGAGIQAKVTGTINLDVQGTVDNAFATASPNQNCPWSPISGLDGITADAFAQAIPGLSAVRVIVNSYTDTAEVQVYVSCL